jgi:hypothetical protein
MAGWHRSDALRAAGRWFDVGAPCQRQARRVGRSRAAASPTNVIPHRNAVATVGLAITRTKGGEDLDAVNGGSKIT